MKNSFLLMLLLILPGCATRVWTETTETFRATGPTTEQVEDRILTEEFFELRTATEVDGYNFSDTLHSTDTGDLNINLLPPALQALTYDHEVTLELYSYTDDLVVWSRVVTQENALDIVREWSVQANLGAEVRLRNKQADLLDRAIERIVEPEVRDNLESIRLKVTIRPDWE